MGSGESKAIAPNCSHIMEGSATPGNGAIHRHPAHYERLMTSPEEGIFTLYDSFQRGVRRSGDSDCLGYRPVVDGKAQPFVFESYNVVNGRARAFGSGLVNLDMIPVIDGMRMIALYLKNSPEWVIAEQGGYTQNVTTVPMYDTLGPETLHYVLNQTELTTILCSPLEVPKVVASKAPCPRLTNVIVTGNLTPELRASIEGVGMRAFAFSEVEESGRASERPLNLPSPNDVATFCYTSGTTGDPKGALLTHGNMVADMAAAETMGITFHSGDYHLSYLPLAHVFERVVQATIYYFGAAIGFYQGDTLKLLDDLAALRPTFFPSVPRLLNRIYDKIMTGAQAGGVKTVLFNRALNAKLYYLPEGYLRHGLWDRLVFSKVAKKVGLDRCRLMVTGSAPLPAHVLDFLRVVFSMTVLEGYGQTEGAAAMTIQDTRDYSSGHVGGPVPCNEIKLVAVEDMGYLPTDTVHGADEASGAAGIPCLGRGEICFRGPNVFRGYYKMPDKTAEAIDSEGWCHSGDIGIWLPTGQLKIVDRKKNIFKLSQGEYIAAEKIENVYQKSSYVAQNFVYGDSFQHCLVGIIVPDEDFLKANWPGYTTLAAAAADPRLKTTIAGELERLAKENKLHGFEKVKDFYISPQPFSVENNLLTPTFKLKRSDAKKFFQAQIDSMYAAMGGVAGRTDLKQG